MPRKIFRQPAVVALLLLFSCLALYQMHVANVRIPISKGLDITRLPKEYERPDTQSEFCEQRFGKTYLHAFENGSASYCDEESASHLTCFSNNINTDHVQPDTFCIGGPTAFYPKQQQFLLQCGIRDIPPEEVQSGVVPLSQLTTYSYQTGSLYIFDRYIKLARTNELNIQLKETKAPTAVLVKREDAQNNPWNALMEIMSTYLTLDILRMTVNPATGTHYFSSSEFDNTQVIILDEIAEGSYFDLWHLFARKPIIRISNLTSLETPTPFKNIITPLPGGSNPFHTQTIHSSLECQNSTLLRAFSSRVLYAYNIATSTTRLLPATSQTKPNWIQLTFINRKGTRRLLQSDRLLSLLRLTYPATVLRIHIIDYAALPFPEQLSITHDNTDVLVGVHGAGLSHAMFLKPGSAVVEFSPFNAPGDGGSKQFENLAHMMEDVLYYRAETEDRSEETKAIGDWTIDDVWVQDRRFLKVMEDVIGPMARRRGLI